MRPDTQPGLDATLAELTRQVQQRNPDPPMVALIVWWRSLSFDPALAAFGNGIKTTTALAVSEISAIDEQAIQFQRGPGDNRKIEIGDIINLRLIPQAQFTARSLIDLDPHNV